MKETTAFATSIISTAIVIIVAMVLMAQCSIKDNELEHARNVALLENGCDTQAVVRLKSQLDEIKKITQRIGG